jgi:hypothetical protein
MGFLGEIKEQIAAIRPSPRDLRKFGLLFLVILGLIAGFLAWKDSALWPWFGAGAFLAGLGGLAWPRGLAPFYKVWMTLAVVLGYIVSRLLLTILFYAVVTPLGLIIRLLGKDLLDLKMGDRESYWHLRPQEDYNPNQTEKMY